MYGRKKQTDYLREKYEENARFKNIHSFIGQLGFYRLSNK